MDEIRHQLGIPAKYVPGDRNRAESAEFTARLGTRRRIFMKSQKFQVETGQGSTCPDDLHIDYDE